MLVAQKSKAKQKVANRHLTLRATFCHPLSRLARSDNTKMCEHVNVGEGLGNGGWVIWMSHVQCVWTAPRKTDQGKEGWCCGVWSVTELETGQHLRCTSQCLTWLCQNMSAYSACKTWSHCTLSASIPERQNDEDGLISSKLVVIVHNQQGAPKYADFKAATLWKDFKRSQDSVKKVLHQK